MLPAECSHIKRLIPESFNRAPALFFYICICVSHTAGSFRLRLGFIGQCRYQSELIDVAEISPACVCVFRALCDVPAHLCCKFAPAILAPARNDYLFLLELYRAVQHPARRKKRKQLRDAACECDEHRRDGNAFSRAYQLKMRCVRKCIDVVYASFSRYFYPRTSYLRY